VKKSAGKNKNISKGSDYTNNGCLTVFNDL